MLYMDLPVVSDPQHCKAADFVVSEDPHGGSGIADQASGVDQADLPAVGCRVPKLVCMAENDNISVQDPGTSCQQCNIRYVIFLAVGHEDPVRDVSRSFHSIYRKGKTARKRLPAILLLRRIEQFEEEGR